jgi:aspartyl-tRNA(Asn)/glutamyl-tRNA(Gln) amidotransferase subunit B
MPVKVDAAWKAGIRAELPELPFDKQRRFFAEYQLPYTITSVLLPDRGLCDFFEEAAKLSGRPQAIGNWIANDLLRELGGARIALAACQVRPAHLAGLVKLVETGVISGNLAKEVFVGMFQSGEAPESIVARQGLRQTTDAGELDQWCAEAIAANPKSVADFKGGKENAINAMKGFVMKQSKGKANPKLVDEILRRKIAG